MLLLLLTSVVNSVHRDELYYAVKTILGKTVSKSEMNRLFEKYDTNKDNTISFEEFCDFLNHLKDTDLEDHA